MLPPLPRCSRWAYSSLKITHPCQPSPIPLSGRPAHRPFRGLLSVYSRCGLHTRAVTNLVTAIRGLQTFFASMPAPVASGWSGRRAGFAPAGKAPPCHGARGKRSFAAIYPNDRLTPITSSNHMMRSSCHPPSTVRRRQPLAHDPPRQSRICGNTQSRARSRSTRALTPGVGRLRTRNRALSEGPRCQARGPTGPVFDADSLTPRAGHGCQRCGSARALKRPRVDYPA